MDISKSQRPVIIPELLKELVHRQIEVNFTFKDKVNEKSKLAQKCYLLSLKLIKSHIVSGLKEPTFENPFEDAQELLLMNGKSTKVHKLNMLYDKLSNLSLTIPELSYIKIHNSTDSKNHSYMKFEDKILKLLLPLYQTGKKSFEQENIEEINKSGIIDNNGIINRSKESNFGLVNQSNNSSIQKTSINHLHRSEIINNTESRTDIESNSLFVLEKCLITPSQELALVHDILYALQGYEAQFIKYDVSKDQYIILPSVYCLQTTRDIVTEICNIGTLFRRMNLILDNIKQKFQTNYFKDRSQLTRTLVEFTHEMLAEYSQFIIGLQSEVQDTMISLSKLDSGINPNYELLNSSRPMLTLRKLSYRIRDQYIRKEKIFAVLEGLFGMNNSCILSGLYLHQNTGNQYHKRIFEQIFNKCTLIWLQDLNKIIKYGISKNYSFEFESKKEFSNDMSELFIKGDIINGLKVDAIHIPIFIQAQVAQKITKICETRVIIKTLLSKEEDSQFINRINVPNITPDLIVDLNRLKLNYHLNQIQKLYSKELLDLIINNGFLINCLKELRDFFLCFKGDYWDYVVQAMFDELEKPCNQVSIQVLNEIFDNSKKIFFRYKHNLENIQVNFCDSNPDSTGWDIFSLDYKINEKSIAIVLTNITLKRYERIFKKIWKYNFVIKKLNSSWINLVKYLRTNELCSENEYLEENNSSEKLIILRQSCCLIRSLILSINAIRNLVTFDSISYIWCVLEHKIPICSSIGDIIDIHDIYLKSIESNLFMTEETEDSDCNNQSIRIYQNLLLCSDLLLETGLYICKTIGTMMSGICFNYYENKGDIVTKLSSEIITCSKNFRSCISSLLDNLKLLTNEEQGKYLHDGQIQFQLNIFKILSNELEQLNFVKWEFS